MLKDLINDCCEFNDKTNLKINGNQINKLVVGVILVFLEIKYHTFCK